MPFALVLLLFAPPATDPSPVAADGTTALHRAVLDDDAARVARLLAAGADPDAATRYGVTPLAIACENGSAAAVGLLLNAGADPAAAPPGGPAPLLTAARTGRLGPVALLLEDGADPNARDRRGQTAAMWAAAAGHADALGLLIDAGADVHTPLPSGFTPFFFAVREGNTAAARRLLGAGVDVNAPMRVARRARNGPRDGTTALVLAVENGHFELAAALLGAGADPGDRGTGYAALHAMSWTRKPLRGDGDPPPRGSGALTDLGFVRVLAAAGADLDLPLKGTPPGRPGLNKKGATALLLACEACDLPLMKRLVELGADPAATNADGSGALLAAAGVGPLNSGDEPAATEAEAVEAITWLLDRGHDVNAVDRRGETAMHGAAYKNRPAVVRLLAARGADPAVWGRKNKAGRTPLSIAEGHRPGNFRPSPETLAALREVLKP